MTSKSVLTRKTGWFESIVGGCEVELENGTLLGLTAELEKELGLDQDGDDDVTSYKEHLAQDWKGSLDDGDV